MAVVHEVVLDRVTVKYGLTVTGTALRKEFVREFEVRDDGWKMWIYRLDTDRGPVLVDYVSFGTDSKRTPDRDSALEALTKWAKDYYED